MKTFALNHSCFHQVKTLNFILVTVSIYMFVLSFMKIFNRFSKKGMSVTDDEYDELKENKKKRLRNKHTPPRHLCWIKYPLFQ